MVKEIKNNAVKKSVVMTTTNKKSVKITTLEELTVVISDIAPLHVARKTSSLATKTTNETKGETTQWTFATLSKLLREYMTETNQHDLPLPNGMGKVTLEEKTCMPAADAALVSFYPAFQKLHCNRVVSGEETEAFIAQLRAQREETRKVNMKLTFELNDN